MDRNGWIEIVGYKWIDRNEQIEMDGQKMIDRNGWIAMDRFKQIDRNGWIEMDGQKCIGRNGQMGIGLPLQNIERVTSTELLGVYTFHDLATNAQTEYVLNM